MSPEEQYIATCNPTGEELAAFRKGFNAGSLDQLMKQCERLENHFSHQPNPEALAEIVK